MPIDTTAAFTVVLYAVCLEALLFFAVVMQTKTLQPGDHAGVARYFGLIFLFQSLSALLSALSEQLRSFLLAAAALIAAALAVAASVPAAAAVAFPSRLPHPLVHVLAAAALAAAAFELAPALAAQPDLPGVPPRVGKQVIAALAVGAVLLAIAALSRICRKMKGRNGAFILLAAVGLAGTAGMLWAWLEPLCTPHSSTTTTRLLQLHTSRSSPPLHLRLQPPRPVDATHVVMERQDTNTDTGTGTDASTDANTEQPKPEQDQKGQLPESCPLPFKAFDHNFLLGVALLATNVLAAEGVLRLMAAGTGIEGYVEIIPVIVT